jgi:hypothetical protein
MTPPVFGSTLGSGRSEAATVGQAEETREMNTRSGGIGIVGIIVIIIVVLFLLGRL